jgi:hypothetical protein
VATAAKPNIYSHLDFPDYEFKEFPKALYKKSGEAVSSKVVETPDDEAAAAADGWVTSLSGTAPPAAKPAKA